MPERLSRLRPPTAPSIDTPSGGPVIDRPAFPAAASEGEDNAVVAAGLANDTGTVNPALPALTTPWRANDPDAYSLTPASVPRYAHLPGGYEWPLPAIDRLRLICLDGLGQRDHLGIMQTVDGQLFHWAEEHRFLQRHLDADSIDSREIRTVARPDAFMGPLRAAAHAACERSLRETNTPNRPR